MKIFWIGKCLKNPWRTLTRLQAWWETMTAVVGRALGWLASWGSDTSSAAGQCDVQKVPVVSDDPTRWTWWTWGGWRHQQDTSGSAEEFWEARDKPLAAMEVEDVRATKKQCESSEAGFTWRRYLPSLPWWSRRKTDGLKEQKLDMDAEFSDYGTPPPSPPPSTPLTSPFRLFANTWNLEILPEHHQICFNFLRHLFDLFTVGFLWTVSPPTKLILEVLGVQGPLRLWLHGMAMFLVSTIGMAGLLWLVQEYLPQFALIYGIVQGVVISVSLRQSVILDTEEERPEEQDQGMAESTKGQQQQQQQSFIQREKMKMN